ncbi:DUF4328 domain-containing protein [Kineococcus arenarius]|uniref:DUF4328 domain-containing protein n=1 Tax=Kineococcus sp. SYSU DK007 TaxID=3383128 RepID=UPI003D7D6365
MTAPQQHGPWHEPDAPRGGPVPLEPVRRRGSAALVLAVVVTAGEGLSALAGFAGGAPAPFSPYGLLVGLTGLAWLAAFVVTCLWLVRVRRNSELVAPAHHHARSRGWAWAGWVVPVVSLWFPFQVVRDALDASASGAGARRVQRRLLALWWAGWLVGQSFTNLASQRATSSVPGDPSTTGALHLVGFLAFVVSLVAWFRVVRAADALQFRAG